MDSRHEPSLQRRSQKSAKGGGHGARAVRIFSDERGALVGGAPPWTPARERGTHLRHLGASLMPMTYYGAPMCIMKAMGRLHRRTVEKHCGIRVIRKVMALRLVR